MGSVSLISSAVYSDSHKSPSLPSSRPGSPTPGSLHLSLYLTQAPQISPFAHTCASFRQTTSAHRFAISRSTDFLSQSTRACFRLHAFWTTIAALALFEADSSREHRNASAASVVV